jgi:hypothetical protein
MILLRGIMYAVEVLIRTVSTRTTPGSLLLPRWNVRLALRALRAAHATTVCSALPDTSITARILTRNPWGTDIL